MEHLHKLRPCTFCYSEQLKDSLNLICKASCKPGTANSSAFSEAHGSLAVMARPTYKPAADGDQASCMTAARTAERQEVVHAVPPTALKTTHSERCNITKTHRWETGQRKTQQWKTAKASKPEVEPQWNEASTKTRGKGLWVLKVAVSERTNLSSREKRKKT